MNRGLTSMSNPGVELGVGMGVGVGGGEGFRGLESTLWAAQRKCLPPPLTKSWIHQRTFKPWSSLLTSSLKTRLLVYARLFLSCLFLQSDDFAHDIFALYCGVEAFASVAFCLTVKSCSALFTLLLKMELALALVRF